MVSVLSMLTLRNSAFAQVDLTEQAVMVGGSCTCSQDQAAVADRSAGRMEARSGKLHESE